MLIELNHPDGAMGFQRGGVHFAHIVYRQTQTSNAVIQRNNVLGAAERRQNFGQVSNAYVRVVDESTGMELIRYDLEEDFSIETAIVVAEIYRHNGEWKFNAIGSGFQGGLEALCINFGVNV